MENSDPGINGSKFKIVFKENWYDKEYFKSPLLFRATLNRIVTLNGEIKYLVHYKNGETLQISTPQLEMWYYKREDVTDQFDLTQFLSYHFSTEHFKEIVK